MSLASKLMVPPRDLIFLQPVANQAVDPDDDWKGYALQPLGPPVQAYSQKAGAGESFIEGKTNTDVNYTIHIDHQRGAPPPLNEKHQLWHPEFSLRTDAGEPDYTQRLLDIQSARIVGGGGGVVLELQAGASY